MNKLLIFFLLFIGLFSYSFNKDYTSSLSFGTKPVVIDDIDEEEEIVISPKEEITANNSEYSNIYKTTVNDFKTIIKNNDQVLLIITGTTCGHCKNYKPVLNGVLKDNNLAAYEIDAWVLTNEETKELVNLVGSFSGVPHTVIMKNGNVSGTLEGNQAKDNIINFLKTNGFIK